MGKTFWVGCATIILLIGFAGSFPQVRNWFDQALPGLGINGRAARQNSAGENAVGANASVANSNQNSSISSLPEFPTNPSEGSLSAPLSPEARQELTPDRLKNIEPFPIQPEVEGTDSLPLASSAESVTRFTQNNQPTTGSSFPQANASNSRGVLVAQLAAIDFVRKIDVTAQSDGIITELFVTEGLHVTAGSPLLELDTRIADAEVLVQTKELDQAKLKASDDSQIQYSKKAYDVAKEDATISDELVRKNAEDQATNRKKKLERDKALLQIKVSEIDHAKDKAAVGVSEAKLEAASVQVALKSVTAPWDGFVGELMKQQFAYVRAGEVIFTLTDLSKLRVRGSVRVNIPPNLLQNARARVSIQVAPGEVREVEGIIGFVAYETKEVDTYPIWIEIDNSRLPDGQYLFRKGMQATIEIFPPTGQ